jgi:2-keto-4-pentenoate hydratase/2-oxohepta-3-ene-1,7-dioic acid hydratase in catechol pathway
VTYSRGSEPRAGVLTADDRIIDLQRASAARGGGTPSDTLPADNLTLLELGQPALDAVKALIEWVAAQDGATRADLARAGAIVDQADSDVRLHAPIPRPRKIMAIGLNYKAHAAELDAELPKHPIVFAKATTCVVGPGDAVEVPRVSECVDWEAELCAVIGRSARHVTRQHALEYVAGYMNGNDVSVRDWQDHSATWMMEKSFDTHGPTGPWLVKSDELPDPAALELKLWVNDELKQKSSTDDLIFDLPAIIEYISTAVTLEPDDIIFTGTPSGVGMGRNPQEWLRAGDDGREQLLDEFTSQPPQHAARFGDRQCRPRRRGADRLQR